MKIPTKTPILSLKGDVVKTEDGKDLTLGELLSSILLLQKSTFDLRKAYDIGMRLYTEKEVEVDAADLRKLKENIENAETIHVFVRGQALALLDDVETKGEK